MCGAPERKCVKLIYKSAFTDMQPQSAGQQNK